MDAAACLQHGNCIPSSLLFRSSSHRPLLLLSRVSVSSVRTKRRNNASSYRIRNMCSASNSDTLLAGSVKEHKKLTQVVSNNFQEQQDYVGDLKSWMHNNGLPPCNVVLKEKPPHDPSHRPIHYVAASEDLQVCSFNFTPLFFPKKKILL